MRVQRLAWLFLGALLGCNGTETVADRGACIRPAELPFSQAEHVARVDRALAGTEADRAAANVRLVSTEELVKQFPRELAAHAAACRGQQTAGVGEEFCDGGVTPGGTVVLVCSTLFRTCVHIIMPAGPVTSCGPNPPGPPA